MYPREVAAAKTTSSGLHTSSPSVAVAPAAAAVCTIILALVLMTCNGCYLVVGLRRTYIVVSSSSFFMVYVQFVLWIRRDISTAKCSITEELLTRYIVQVQRCVPAAHLSPGSRLGTRDLSCRGRVRGRARSRSAIYRQVLSRDYRVFGGSSRVWCFTRRVAVGKMCHETKNVDGYLRNDLMHTQQDVCCTLPTFSSSVYSAINVDSKSKF